MDTLALMASICFLKLLHALKVPDIVTLNASYLVSFLELTFVVSLVCHLMHTHDCWIKCVHFVIYPD